MPAPEMRTRRGAEAIVQSPGEWGDANTPKRLLLMTYKLWCGWKPFQIGHDFDGVHRDSGSWR